VQTTGVAGRACVVPLVDSKSFGPTGMKEGWGSHLVAGPGREEGQKWQSSGPLSRRNFLRF